MSLSAAEASLRWGGAVTVVEHPLVQHKLTLMRDGRTTTSTFRALMRETATLSAMR